MESGRPDAGQMVVHNLKAPVTGIVATLEMLADGDFGPLSGRQQAAVREMQDYSTELLGLLDELLDTWRLDSGAVRVHVGPVALAPVLDAVRRDWSARLSGRLTIDAVPDDLAAAADAAVLRRVLGNLLLNAATHGGGAVHVRIGATARDGAVRVTVADDGPGVPADQAERIFEPFVRLGGATRGSGLGLAYCRAACAAMAGRIDLAPVSSGATFVLELPRAAVP